MMKQARNLKWVTALSSFLLCLPSLVAGADETQLTNAINEIPAIEKNIGIDQKLGSLAAIDSPFLDESGRKVNLRQLLNKGPVLLSLVYYGCPSLCGMVMGGVFRSLSSMKLKMGTEYQVVFASIDPSEGPELALKKKKAYVKSYLNEQIGAGLHFLTGTPESISALAQSVGFRYIYDEKTKQYAHPGAAIVLTPDGHISRYHFGVEYPSSDVRLSLVNASGMKIGSLVDQFLLFCYHYDPTTGKYGFVIFRALQGLSLLTIAGMALLVIYLLRRERSRRERAVELIAS